MTTQTLPRRKRLTAPTFSKIRRALEEHLKARKLSEEVKIVQESYRDRLRDEFLPTYGVEDSNGNFWISFEETPVVSPKGEEVFGIKAERRAPVIFDAEAAEELIRSKDDKGLVSRCIQKVTTYVVDEDALLAASYEDPELLSPAEIEGLYEEGKVTYAFVLVKKPFDTEDLA